MKSEREIEMLIKRTNQEIKTIQPTIKSMGSPEARALARLEGKVEAFKEIIEEDKKKHGEMSVGAHGTHTTTTTDGDVITNGSIDINHIDPILTPPTNKQ